MLISCVFQVPSSLRSSCDRLVKRAQDAAENEDEQEWEDVKACAKMIGNSMKVPSQEAAASLPGIGDVGDTAPRMTEYTGRLILHALRVGVEVLAQKVRMLFLCVSHADNVPVRD